jgi:hypothetical protein
MGEPFDPVAAVACLGRDDELTALRAVNFAMAEYIQVLEAKLAEAQIDISGCVDGVEGCRGDDAPHHECGKCGELSCGLNNRCEACHKSLCWKCEGVVSVVQCAMVMPVDHKVCGPCRDRLRNSINNVVRFADGCAARF